MAYIKGKDALNVRERYLAVLSFKPVDRTLMAEVGFLAATMRRWYREGLPKTKGVPDTLADGSGAYYEDHYDVTTYFKLDYMGPSPPSLTGTFSTGEPGGLVYPAFEEKVLEDHGGWVLRRTSTGTIVRDRKDKMTLPLFLSGPVKTREDWEEFKKERLRPRLPDNWDEETRTVRTRDYPIVVDVEIWQLMSQLMGIEPLMKMCVRDPDFARDMANTITDLWTKVLPRMISGLQADAIMISEDMCYKNGPFISPRLYREIFLSAYRKVISISRDNGSSLICLDTDGDCRMLIPFFLEAGINFILPFEVTGGQDVLEVRKQYPKLAIQGGLDKKILPKGKDAIDKELDSKIPFMLEHGGYIPQVDHNVTPDTPFENYAYYRRKLNKLILDAARK